VPTFARQALRRSLGRDWLRDTYVGSVTGSWAQTSYSANIVDYRVADLALSGQNRYVGAWILVGSTGVQFQVGSFNVASGAYVSQAVVIDAAGTFVQTPSGVEYERHEIIPPSDKDRALDDAVQRVRVLQEIGVAALSGAEFYDIDAVASPHRIARVLGAWAWADPTNTGNRDRRELSWWGDATTGSGSELRVSPALGAGDQLVVEALLELTLGAADTATVELPDDRLVLAAAASKCFDALAQRAPGTQVAAYERRRDDAARTFADLAARYKPLTSRPLRFRGEVF